MRNDSTDPELRTLEERLDRIASELRQIKYLMWFLSCVGAVVVINELPKLVTNVFYVAVLISAVAGLWYLASRAAEIPVVQRWRGRKSADSTTDRP